MSLANNMNSHRTTRSRTSSDCIVHCRCGSVYDENSLVQCYACQVRFLQKTKIRLNHFSLVMATCCLCINY